MSGFDFNQFNTNEPAGSILAAFKQLARMDLSDDEVKELNEMLREMDTKLWDFIDTIEES